MQKSGFKVKLFIDNEQTEEFVEGFKMSIGRDVTVDLPIVAKGVSRNHLVVFYQSGKLIISDQGSTNGTYINRSKLEVNVPVECQQGEKISLGQAGCHLKIEIVENEIVPSSMNPSGKENSVTGFSQIGVTQNGIVKSLVDVVSNLGGPVDEESKASKQAHKYIQNAEKLVQKRKSDAEFAIDRAVDKARAKAKETLRQAQQEALKIRAQIKKNVELSKVELDLMQRKSKADAQKIMRQAQDEKAKMMDSAKKDVESLKIQAAKLGERNANVKKELDSFAESRKEKAEEFRSLELKYGNLKDDYDDEVKTLKRSVSQVDDELADKKRKLDLLKLENEEAVSSQERKIKEFQKKYDEFNKVYDLETTALEKVKINLLEAELKTKSFEKEALELEKKARDEKEVLRKIDEDHDVLVRENKKELQEIQDLKTKSTAEIDQKVQFKLDEAEEASRAILEAAQIEKTEFLAIAKKKISINEEASSKRLKDEEEKVLDAKGRMETLEIEYKNKIQEIEDFKAKSESEVEEKFKEKIEDAQREAAVVLKEAHIEKEAVLLSAEEKASSLEASAKAKIVDLEEQRKKVQLDLREMKSLKDQNEHEMEEKAKALTRAAEEQASMIIKSASKEKEDLLQEIKQMQANSKTELESLKLSTQKELDLLLSKGKKTASHELAEFKVKRLKEVETELKQKKNLQNEYQKEQIDVWAKSIGLSLQSSLSKNYDLSDADPFGVREEIERISKSILMGEVPEEEEEIKRLMGFDPTRMKQVKKYWRNTAVSGAFLVLGLLLYPKIMRSVKSNVIKMAQDQKAASANYVKNIEQKRIDGKKFDTVKVAEYKATYTDRVLYTQDYVKNELDRAYREEWSLNLDTYFVESLRLSDNAIFTFISKESILVQDLADLRDKIDAKRSDAGIQKMHDLELTFEKDVKSLLRTEGKYMMFTEFKKAYYQQNYMQIRQPAQK